MRQESHRRRLWNSVRCLHVLLCLYDAGTMRLQLQVFHRLAMEKACSSDAGGASVQKAGEAGR